MMKKKKCSTFSGNALLLLLSLFCGMQSHANPLVICISENLDTVLLDGIQMTENPFVIKLRMFQMDRLLKEAGLPHIADGTAVNKENLIQFLASANYNQIGRTKFKQKLKSLGLSNAQSEVILRNRGIHRLHGTNVLLFLFPRWNFEIWGHPNVKVDLHPNHLISQLPTQPKDEDLSLINILRTPSHNEGVGDTRGYIRWIESKNGLSREAKIKLVRKISRYERFKTLINSTYMNGILGDSETVGSIKSPDFHDLLDSVNFSNSDSQLYLQALLFLEDSKRVRGLNSFMEGWSVKRSLSLQELSALENELTIADNLLGTLKPDEILLMGMDGTWKNTKSADFVVQSANGFKYIDVKGSDKIIQLNGYGSIRRQIKAGEIDAKGVHAALADDTLHTVDGVRLKQGSYAVAIPVQVQPHFHKGIRWEAGGKRVIVALNQETTHLYDMILKQLNDNNRASPMLLSEVHLVDPSGRTLVTFTRRGTTWSR